MIRETEALLVRVIGTEQNDITFQHANAWERLWRLEVVEMRLRERVDPRPLTGRSAEYS